MLICCTFFVIFGILGVQLFKGALFYCEGPDVRFVRNKTDCLADPRNHWINRKYNFDNLGQALMALFVLSSKDGWVNIMYTGLDAVGKCFKKYYKIIEIIINYHLFIHNRGRSTTSRKFQ